MIVVEKLFIARFSDLFEEEYKLGDHWIDFPKKERVLGTLKPGDEFDIYYKPAPNNHGCTGSYTTIKYLSPYRGQVISGGSCHSCWQVHESKPPLTIGTEVLIPSSPYDSWAYIREESPGFICLNRKYYLDEGWIYPPKLYRYGGLKLTEQIVLADVLNERTAKLEMAVQE